MDTATNQITGAFYAKFKAFHELMAVKVREILLVSSPYDAFILEEDGSLASRIINEYSGLNLSLPPRVTRIASAKEALGLLDTKPIDMVSDHAPPGGYGRLPFRHGGQADSDPPCR